MYMMKMLSLSLIRWAIAACAALVMMAQISGARQFIYQGESPHHSANLGDTVIYGIGDTFELVEFTRAALKCIHHNQWSECRGAGRFALLQYVPAAVAIERGYTTGQAMRFLGELNLYSFWVLFIAATVFFGERRVVELFVFFLLIVTSPLLVYARLTFGEMLAATMTCLFGMAVMSRRRWWIIAVLGLLVGTSKDIAAPFVVLLGLAAIGPDLFNHPQQVRPQLLGVGAAGILGLLPGAAFNYFRFGTPFNEVYLSIPLTESLQTIGSYLLAVWMAPNFGMLFFWPTLCAFVGCLAVALWRQQRPSSKTGLGSLAAWFPLLASVGALLALSLGLARTGYSTAGFSWPPRYLLPWCPVVLAILLHHYGQTTRRMLGSVIHRKMFVGIIAVICICGLPNLLVNFRPHFLSAVSQVPFEPGCPRMPSNPLGWGDPVERTYFFECEYYRMWRPKRFTILEAMKIGVGPSGRETYTASVLAYGIVVSVLGLELRRHMLSPNP